MRYPLIFTCLALFATSQSTLANGLEDLHQRLEQLKGQSAITARFQVNHVQIEDEGEDQKIENGEVSIKLAADAQGLSVNYGKQVLEKIELENQAKIEDEEADTPTLNAIGTFNTQELKNALNAANQLKRTLSRAIFKSEETVEFEEQTVRKLSFEMPLEAVIDNKKTRDYVDDFSSSFEVFIDETGTPLKTVSTYKGKGRAYIVLSLEAQGSTTVIYKQHEDRLLRVLSDSNYKYDSTFGKSEFIESNELEVLGSELIAKH